MSKIIRLSHHGNETCHLLPLRPQDCVNARDPPPLLIEAQGSTLSPLPVSPRVLLALSDHRSAP
jgi:hypothetical protein